MKTINDIPSDDRQRILDKVLAQINSMDAAELKIIAQTEQSLADFVAQVFQSFAKLLGYVIAYAPETWAPENCNAFLDAIVWLWNNWS